MKSPARSIRPASLKALFTSFNKEKQLQAVGILSEYSVARCPDCIGMSRFLNDFRGLLEGAVQQRHEVL